MKGEVEEEASGEEMRGRRAKENKAQGRGIKKNVMRRKLE